MGATKSESDATGPIVRPFGEVWPRIDARAWLAPGAVVVGDVTVGPDSSIWYGSVLRGDVNFIRIGARSNLQDHCVMHVTRDRFSCEIGDEVTVGHRATVHGCVVEEGALIGIGAIVLDGAEIGGSDFTGATLADASMVGVTASAAVQFDLADLRGAAVADATPVGGSTGVPTVGPVRDSAEDIAYSAASVARQHE